MYYQWFADLVVVVHFVFILFVVLGGFLAMRWRKLIYYHLPAVVWGVFIEFSGGICPLTPLENWFRQAAGQSGYEGGFIEQYLVPIIYPVNLTRDLQITFGLTALSLNIVAYGVLIYARGKRR
jgi:hypothetical protein